MKSTMWWVFAVLMFAACGEVQEATDAAGDEPGEHDAAPGAEDAGDGDAAVSTDCDSDEDCTSPGASRCDLATNTCVACESNEHCAHFGDDYQCEVGSCFQCRFQAVSAAQSHTCGLRNNGSIWCWGANSRGQLGNGDESGEAVPFPIHLEHFDDWQRVATGPQGADFGTPWTCGIREDGSLWCWGSSREGRLGNGELGDTSDMVLEPTQITEHAWTDLALGTHHGCALRDDSSIWCWGRNSSGQLGQGDTEGPIAQPALVDTVPDWTQVRAGGNSSCGIRDGGSLWCWGSNSSGQLGQGEDADSSIPQPRRVGDEENWSDVSVGGSHVCAIRDDQTLWCWGRNFSGELGLGPDAENTVYAPARVGVDDDWLSIAAASGYTCGVRQGGALYCWGSSGSGKLGLGELEENVHEPRRVTQPDGGWARPSLWASHTCAIRDGEVWCWGANGSGELGLGHTGDQENQPAQVECPVID